MQLSNLSKVWIYQSNSAFTADEEAKILSALQNFVNQWESHGSKLTALSEIRYNRFIILQVDEEQTGASGCSIDKSVNLMKQFEREFNINLFDRLNIAWRDGENIFSCGRAEFETFISKGIVTENTIVFNNMVQTLADLETRWEIPFKNSWHAKVFGDLLNV